jgi:hypothetical protein
VGDCSEDDDFLDVELFALDAEKVSKEYKEVVDYLFHHKFFKHNQQITQGKDRP